jgi:hypothetical protein
VLLARVRRRVRRLLIRRGRWPGEDAGSDPFAAQAPVFASAVAASVQGRIALGLRAGPVRRLRSAATATSTGRRSARLEGFSLHADVVVPARRRDQLEKVCRYILRPPLAVERLTESTGGQLQYQFRRPRRDGSTALLVDPLELLERLAALVPPPRRPLLAYHGVVAPHAGWRAAIVPAAPRHAQPAGPELPRASGRLPRATLLRRVFAIEVLVCPRCAGPRRIVGAVTEPHAVRRLLGALGLAAQPLPHRSVTISCPAVDPGVHPRRPRPGLPADPRGRLSPTSPRVRPACSGPCRAGLPRTRVRPPWECTGWADGRTGEGGRKQLGIA